MWEFSVALYMITLWPDSVILAAIYGAIESASIAFFGPLVGQWVQSLSYIQVLRIWLVTQNLSFIIAGSIVVVLITFSSWIPTNSILFISLVILTNISGVVGVLSTLAGTILIEREWVVVISEGQPLGVLTNMNLIIRRIDLTYKLLAPLVSGLLISFVSVKASAMNLAIWNCIAVWIEYWLFTSVYKGIPAIAQSSLRKTTSITSPTQSQIERESLLSTNDYEKHLARTWTRKLTEWTTKAPFIGAWNVYLQQNIMLPAVALALLYFTVRG